VVSEPALPFISISWSSNRHDQRNAVERRQLLSHTAP
jgi:hypothetical protein